MTFADAFAAYKAGKTSFEASRRTFEDAKAQGSAAVTLAQQQYDAALRTALAAMVACVLAWIDEPDDAKPVVTFTPPWNQ